MSLPRFEKLLVLVVTLQVALLAGVWAHFNVNFPNADDFDLVLRSTLRVFDAPNISQKLKILFEPHVDHYVVFARLVAIALREIHGSIDFSILTFIGMMAIPIATWQIGSEGFRFKSSHLLSLFVLTSAIYLAAPAPAEALLWSSASLTGMWVFPFVIAALKMHDRNSWLARISSALFSIVATLTHGSGVLVFPVLAVLSLGRRRFFSAIFSAAAFTLVLFLRPHHKLPTPSIETLDYFLTLLGSSVGLGTHPLSLLCGTAGAFVFLYVLAQGLRKQSPVLCGLIAFCILTAGVQALIRASDGIEFAFTQSRYYFSSQIFIAGIFLAMGVTAEERERKNLGAVLLIGAMVYTVAAWRFAVPELQLRQEILRDARLSWSIEHAGLPYPVLGDIPEVLKKAEHSGVFPAVTLLPTKERNTESKAKLPKETASITGDIDFIHLGDKFLIIRGWAEFKSPLPSASNRQIVLEGAPGRSAVFSVEPRIRPDVSRHLSLPLDNSGFFAIIPRADLPEPLRSVGILLTVGGKTEFRRFKHF